jgi:TPR repeat protein
LSPERVESNPKDAEDPAADREGFGKACINGDAGACLAAAFRYGWMEGFRHDLKTAEMLLVHGCELRDADACNELGMRLRLGELPEASKARSAALFERACTLGLGHACVSVAVDVWEGVLDSPNPKKGAAMLKAQCDAGGGGGGSACERLARYAESAAFGQSQIADARALYVRACRLGIVQACDKVK